MTENNNDFLQRVMREAQETQARHRAEAADRAAESDALSQRLAHLTEVAEQTGQRFDKFKSDLTEVVDKTAEVFARQMAAMAQNQSRRGAQAARR